MVSDRRFISATYQRSEHEMLTQTSEWFQLKAIIGCHCWYRTQTLCRDTDMAKSSNGIIRHQAMASAVYGTYVSMDRRMIIGRVHIKRQTTRAALINMEPLVDAHL